MSILLILLTYLPPSQDVRRDHVDVIEKNTVYAETIESDEPQLMYAPQCTQFLFRNWEHTTGNHEIHAWRMSNKAFFVEERERIPLADMPADLAEVLERQAPLRRRTTMYVDKNQATGLFEMRWLDGDLLRVVTADSYCETYTVGDIEVLERERWDKSKRTELRRR